MSEHLLSGFSHRHWAELGEFAEVLDRCREEELIFGAVWSSEAEAVEADNAFEVSKEHLDLLSSPAGIGVGICRHDAPGSVACRLVDMA